MLLHQPRGTAEHTPEGPLPSEVAWELGMQPESELKPAAPSWRLLGASPEGFGFALSFQRKEASSTPRGWQPCLYLNALLTQASLPEGLRWGCIPWHGRKFHLNRTHFRALDKLLRMQSVPEIPKIKSHVSKPKKLFFSAEHRLARLQPGVQTR